MRVHYYNYTIIEIEKNNFDDSYTIETILIENEMEILKKALNIQDENL